MSEFFERPVLGGRIGNDLEPMLFYDDMVPRIAAALTAQMADPDPMIRRLALEALVTIRGDPIGRAGPSGRAAARRYRRLGPHLGDHDDEGVSAEGQPRPSAIPRRWHWSMSCRTQPGTEAQAAALDLIGRLGPLSGIEPSADPAPKVRSRLTADRRDRSRRGLERASGHFPLLWTERPVREAIKRGLGDADPQARAAAVRLALEPKAKIAESALRKALDDPAPDGAHRPARPDRLRSEARETTCACSAS